MKTSTGGGVVKKHRRHFVQRRAVGDRADEPMDERRGEGACGGVGQGLIVRHFGARMTFDLVVAAPQWALVRLYYMRSRTPASSVG